jgi:hypothetical protein
MVRGERRAAHVDQGAGDRHSRRDAHGGNYTRHSFLYVVPPAEPGAGQTVAMILVNEQTVNLRQAASAADAAQAPVQVWHRCAPTISSIGPRDRPLTRGLT